MPITILDYVKSVVGDKDIYTAEDCLTSGVDIIGGCQACAATIAVYNAYPSTYRVLALRRLHRRHRIRHHHRLHRPPRHANLPVLREHRHHQRNPHHHQRTHRGIRAGMRRLRRGLAAMTTNPALDWLDARFEQIAQRHDGDFRHAPATANGMAPTHVRPMIELLSVMDAGPSMRVIPRDYDDPDRWPL